MNKLINKFDWSFEFKSNVLYSLSIRGAQSLSGLNMYKQFGIKSSSQACMTFTHTHTHTHTDKKNLCVSIVIIVVNTIDW